jgi:DNA-binding transcriptional MerR regulator/effector-binding domain-containing protein
MFSIGEFARLGTVSVRTLRHYDEIGLLRPAEVDPQIGYRYYSASQLGQLNRIVALKELGLSLAQANQLLAGITPGELQGMLMLRRAQLEQELAARENQLLEVEARLGYIAKEGTMPADDITVKKIPARGVVALTGPAPAYGPQHIVPIVNRLREQFDLLGIPGLAKVTGPYMIFYEDRDGNDITVHLALPVAGAPAELPPPAKYLVLPEIEAVVAVRSGAAASIFPTVYYDLARWADAHGYQTRGPGRELWVKEVDDIAEVSQQVIEIQLPFTRPETLPPGVSRGAAGAR